MESEPLAVIRVTFDNLPNELKVKLELFFGISCACLILLNIIMCFNILDIIYKKARLINNNNNYYEPV